MEEKKNEAREIDDEDLDQVTGGDDKDYHERHVPRGADDEYACDD